MIKREELVEAVSDRTGIMPEVTEIVIETSCEVVGAQMREKAGPAAVAAGALLLGGVILRRLRRRGQE